MVLPMFVKTLMIAALFCTCSNHVFAGALEDGQKAYEARNYKAAAQFYEQAANQGHAIAQHRLGIMYFNGQGLAQSDERAIELFRKAADQKFSDAQYYLGTLYKVGRGVEMSKQRAAELLREAADQDHPAAQFSLASLYFYGQGVPQSKDVALIWLKKAAALGDLSARAKLKQFGIE